jgi:hypothetical protein
MPMPPAKIIMNLRGLNDMEYRRVSIGYDSEAGIYFVCSAEFRHLTIEAKSMSALHHKLEVLELHPVLSPIYGASAPEFQRASLPRTERQSAKRLVKAAIPSRQRRGR